MGPSLKSFAIALAACLSLAACDSGPPVTNTSDVLDNGEPTMMADPTPEEIAAARRAAGEIVYCGQVRKQVARAECARIEGVVKNLERGEAALDVPPDMVRGETRKVTFAIVGSSADQTAREVVGIGSGNVETFRTKVGAEMAAELIGEGFTIAPAGRIRKDLGVADAERWEWDVTPLKARRYRLAVKAYVVIPSADGTPRDNYIKTFDHEARVKVTVPQRVGDWMDDSSAWLQKSNNWLKTLAAFLTALGGVIVAFRALRPKPKPAPPA